MTKPILVFMCLLLAVFLPTDLKGAQPPGKVYRIGFLDFRFRSTATDPRFVALRQGLSDLGYVEGQNLVLEYRSANGKRERLPEVAAELIRLKVDVIVTSGAITVARAAKQATRTIPILMAGTSADPVEAGLVESLARPGGNITGLTSREVDLHGKRLELLKQTFPGISRVAIIWTPIQQKQAIREVTASGQALGVEIQSVFADPQLGLASLENALSEIKRESPDALVFTSSALTLRHRARVVEFAAKRRLPTIYGSEVFVDAGGLMSYGVDNTDSYSRAAIYVDKILKGAKPGDLPIERLTKFELVINLKAARQIGLPIPQSVLYRADRVLK